jgi:hypothetical protein
MLFALLPPAVAVEKANEGIGFNPSSTSMCTQDISSVNIPRLRAFVPQYFAGTSQCDATVALG